MLSDENTHDVVINGTTYKSLADGEYDIVVLGTGIKECILAGLLAVRGKKILQIDRNDYYGGECATLNLEELYKKNDKKFDKDQVEAKFGNYRRYCIDLVPKLLMANGKLVKMLLQTGVTKYIDFNGIAGSYVFHTNKIYKLPVTPSEALMTSLVGMFQKTSLRSFVQFIAKYLPRNKESDKAINSLTGNELKEIISVYYKEHNPEKTSEVEGLIHQFTGRRPQLIAALERKYGIPVLPKEQTATFQSGPMGLRIEAQIISQSTKKKVIRVVGFAQQQNNTKGQGEASGKCFVGDIISKVNGESIINLDEKEQQEKIVKSPRPLELTFMRPTESEQALKVIQKSKNDSASVKYNKIDLRRVKMNQVFKDFGLDDNSQNFLGHAMALHTTDDYLEKPAEETIEALKLYGQSCGRYGQASPYLYPLYGLSTLPEGFSRLAAVYGGVVILRHEPEEILKDSNGKACGVRIKDRAATCTHVIGDYSYFEKEKSKSVGKVIRSICILKHPVKNAPGDSAQIILPAKHLKNKNNDVYISIVSSLHQVAPKDIYLAIVSTRVETNDPVNELSEAFKLLEPIEERFDSVSDLYAPTDDGSTDNLLVVPSLDETSHFQSSAKDIETIYQQVMDIVLDLDEKLVKDPEQ